LGATFWRFGGVGGDLGGVSIDIMRILFAPHNRLE